MASAWLTDPFAASPSMESKGKRWRVKRFQLHHPSVRQKGTPPIWSAGILPVKGLGPSRPHTTSSDHGRQTRRLSHRCLIPPTSAISTIHHTRSIPTSHFLSHPPSNGLLTHSPIFLPEFPRSAFSIPQRLPSSFVIHSSLRQTTNQTPHAAEIWAPPNHHRRTKTTDKYEHKNCPLPQLVRPRTTNQTPH